VDHILSNPDKSRKSLKHVPTSYNFYGCVQDEERQQRKIVEVIDFEESQPKNNSMLHKLMGNLAGNTLLRNVNLRNKFKLDRIKQESDLQNYKNLLNAMAALFYANHSKERLLRPSMQ
jgi:predicted aconitase